MKTFTVSELIRHLKDLNPDAKVLVHQLQGVTGFSPINDILVKGDLNSVALTYQEDDE